MSAWHHGSVGRQLQATGVFFNLHFSCKFVHAPFGIYCLAMKKSALKSSIDALFEEHYEARMLLGKHLRSIRRASGITLVALAADTGVHHSHLSRVENGIAPLAKSD